MEEPVRFHLLQQVRDYWNSEIEFRAKRPELSSIIAIRAFNNTHETVLGFRLPVEYDNVRNEFGALEAPGTPPLGSDITKFEDGLWKRIANIVNTLS